jgi:hypothetical protein
MMVSGDRAGAYGRAAPCAAWLALACHWVGCGPPPEPASPLLPLDPPAVAGAMAPNLATSPASVVLSWLEPAAGRAHRLRLSRLEGEGWSEPVTIVSGEAFFANWADVPSVAIADDGTFLAHWLRKTGAETYAYTIELGRSFDDGLSWETLGPLPDDTTPTEHGFVSMVPAREGGFHLVWLDGREMATGGDMALRTAELENQPGPSRILDSRVCECCQTAAARTLAGVVVAYRDRSSDEVRDIAVVRHQHGAWTEPRVLHEDGWQIAGCPVNGPAIAGNENRVVVAWFTAARDRARVQVAFSADGGATFSPPIVVDEESPLGRVDVVLTDGDDAVVSWLAADAEEGDAEGGAIRLGRVSFSGRRDPVLTVAHTSPSRASGFPQLVRHGDHLYLAWVEVGKSSRLRVTRIARLPPVPSA